MLRKTLCLTLALLTIAAVTVQPARADMASALKMAPADYHVVVVFKNVGAINNKVVDLAKKLNLADSLPPGGDLIPLMTQEVGLDLGQLDRAGSVLLLVPALPAEEGADLKAAALLPVKDYAAFKAANKAATKDGREIIVLPGEQVVFIKQIGAHVAIADAAAMVDQLAQPARALADALSAEQRSLADACDVYVHVNVPPVWALLKPMIDKELRGGGELDALRAVMGLLDSVGRDMAALDGGLLLAADGVELRLMLTAKPGSALAKALATVPAPTGGLVRGVPAENFLIAGGFSTGALDPNNELVKRLLDMVAKGLGETTGQPEQADRVVKAALKLLPLVKHKSVSLTAADKDGQPALPIALNTAVEVTDPAAARQAARDYLKELIKLAPAPAAADPSQPAPAPILSFQEDAETVGSVKVDVLTVKLDEALGGLGPAAAVVKKVLGEQNLVMRLASSDNMLVITVAGGPAAMEQALKAAAAKTVLDELPGPRKVKGHVVPGACGVIYVAGDRLASLVLRAVGEMVGAPLPPFPKTNEPIVLSGGIKGSSIEIRLFGPISLIEAGVKYYQQVQAPGEPQVQD